MQSLPLAPAHGRLLPANVYDPNCDSRRLLDTVMNKWSPLILALLAHGPMRYNTLRREIGGISHKMLTQNLRALEEAGIITRTVYPVIPPHVEYALTEPGESLLILMREMIRWIETYKDRLNTEKANAEDEACTLGMLLDSAAEGADAEDR